MKTDMVERTPSVKQLADQNIGLLFAFVRDFCNWDKTKISELSLAYMKGIADFAASDTSLSISTYIYRSLEWEMCRIRKSHRGLIYVPAFNQKTEAIRERAKASLRIVHFHGKEGKCNDSALLHYDDHNALLSKVIRSKVVRRLLRALTYRQRIVIQMRFGFGDGEEYSYRQIGTVLGVTRERVRQIESKALRMIAERANKFCMKELNDC